MFSFPEADWQGVCCEAVKEWRVSDSFQIKRSRKKRLLHSSHPFILISRIPEIRRRRTGRKRIKCTIFMILYEYDSLSVLPYVAVSKIIWDITFILFSYWISTLGALKWWSNDFLYKTPIYYQKIGNAL